jgi:biotin carboxylase
MCGWGAKVPVASEVAPPVALFDHWRSVFSDAGVPVWESTDKLLGPVNAVGEVLDVVNDAATGDSVDGKSKGLITLFPHQSLPAQRQLVDPDVYYHLHSKQAIAEIDCDQAEVFDGPQFPCIAKLSHGYAGLGNFRLDNAADLAKMKKELDRDWPGAELVYNSVVENIVGDYGVQFYLHRDGSVVWLGVTQQHFSESSRWCGGSFSAELQRELVEPMEPFVIATAAFLQRHGYFGVVGIDVLVTEADERFLVDLNPRLTGISPFLMASRFFQNRHGHRSGVYRASCRFAGTLEQLIAVAESQIDVTVLVLSAVEQDAAGGVETICHLSASADSESQSDEVLDKVLAGPA